MQKNKSYEQIHHHGNPHLRPATQMESNISTFITLRSFWSQMRYNFEGFNELFDSYADAEQYIKTLKASRKISSDTHCTIVEVL